MNGLRIRTMRPDEISIALNWAAAKGWNPSLADDACFAAADPEGFCSDELDGAPVGLRLGAKCICGTADRFNPHGMH